MKIYVVTSGEYSNYNIDAVFSDLNKAESYVATHEPSAFGGIRIEKYETRDEMIDAPFCDKELWEINLTPKKRTRYMVKTPTYRNVNKIEKIRYGYTVCMTLKKHASKKQAKKIACDRIAEYEAREQGV